VSRGGKGHRTRAAILRALPDAKMALDELERTGEPERAAELE